MINNFFTQEKNEEAIRKANLLKVKNSSVENDLIKKISSHIETIDEIKPGNSHLSDNNGSLFNMFSSSFFDINMLIIYLDKFDDCGVIDTLINIMYNRFINQSLFFLPQLCTLITYKSYTESLENYILDRCVDQMKFSLQVHWLVTSYHEDKMGKKEAGQLEKLLQKIEMTMVNGRRCTKNLYQDHNKQLLTRDSQLFHIALDKELRLKYFDTCAEFYSKLKSICEKLMDFPRESNKPNNRNSILKDYIYLFNENLKNQRAEMTKNEHTSTVKDFFNGMILPFDDYHSTLDEHSTIIVRFIPEYAFCFSTKARVPVKLCAECVRVSECAKWNELILNEEDISDIKDEKKNNLSPMTSSDAFVVINSSPNVITKSLNDFMLEMKNDIQSNNHLLITQSTEDTVTIDFNPDVINPFGNKWTEIQKEIKATSAYRNFESYTIKNFIAKANDDLRQELLAMQLIKRFHQIFFETGLKLRPYDILITSSSSGLIEFLPNTNSIDGIKKKLPSGWNLNTFYRNFFRDSFEEAQKNFVQSLAAYNLICYLLQIKDRHNGNILIDMRGNIIHIDYGFILGINPGNLNFESAPFKLTVEYVQILDGMDSPVFEYYKSLLFRGMLEAKKHVDSFVKIVEVMAKGSKMPCFENGDINIVLAKFRERFHERKSETDLRKTIDELIHSSYNNFWTNKYDLFQKLTNGIYT